MTILTRDEYYQTVEGIINETLHKTGKTMHVTCTSNYAFEDMLTEGRTYTILDYKGVSVKVKDDKGVERWFGCQKFEVENLV